MKVKIKDWEDFERDIKPLCNSWVDNIENEEIEIQYNDDICWRLHYKHKYEIFGKIVDVKELDRYSFENFTHYSKKSVFLYHELWFEPEFEPIEFITEEEFSV